MIIVKFTILASYTKRIASSFYAHRENVIHVLADGRGTAYGKHPMLMSTIRTRQIPRNSFAFLTVEDEIDTYQSPVEAIDSLSRDHRVIVLLPIISIAERVKSLILRELASSQCGRELECYIRDAFTYHLKAMTNLEAPSLDRANFDTIMGLSDLGDLIKLHADGRVRLIPVSAGAILGGSSKILNACGLDSDKSLASYDSRVIMNRRMPKEITLERKRSLSEILAGWSDRIRESEARINDALRSSNLEVL